jgi:DNA-directed RNA polymerase subunit beta'
VLHPETGEIIVDRNEMIDEVAAETIESSGVLKVYVRSPLTCKQVVGLCALCYGRDLGRGYLVEIGSAVGIVAAQSIGEPGTQLTLRTFHTGGTAQEADITQGLPRVEELFEARKKPKGESVITDIDGTVYFDERDEIRYITVTNTRLMREEYDIKGWDVQVEDGQEVEPDQVLASKGEEVFKAPRFGRIVLAKKQLTFVYEEKDEREYEIPSASRLIKVEDPESGTYRPLQNGDKVRAGTQLTEGSKNPHRILRILGLDATQYYLLDEVQQVYRQQGVNISDKHFEIMIRKMLSKVQITRSGDTQLLPGEFIDRLRLRELNETVIASGGTPASGQNVLLGLTKSALSTESFLSASSFQHTIKVLAGAAIAGAEDPLVGLKENVIIGKLIPAGTGFHHYLQRREALETSGIAIIEAGFNHDVETDRETGSVTG